LKLVCSGALTEREALARNYWPAPEVMANPNTDELGNLGLSRAEERAIVASKGPLSDGYGPAAGQRQDAHPAG
jgi:cytochrome c peroxidase